MTDAARASSGRTARAAPGLPVAALPEAADGSAVSIRDRRRWT
ncbi:hypothetical protein [Streptomyces aureoversilis]|uniref:Uncharacterized protein n=1 Tax=Streptomyces aureoversilis TaxID=67277 RepID=A0ABW0A5Z9_9ACTN